MARVKPTYYLCDECHSRSFSVWSSGQLVLMWCSQCNRDTSHTRDDNQAPPPKWPAQEKSHGGA